MNRLIGLFFLISFFAGHYRAQNADYVLTHFDESHFPQKNLNSAQLDKNLFLWINTEFGLVRFDGQHFKTFDQGNFPVIESNRIKRLQADDEGQICFADEFGNVFRVVKSTSIASAGTLNDYFFNKSTFIIRRSHVPMALRGFVKRAQDKYNERHNPAFKVQRAGHDCYALSDDTLAYATQDKTGKVALEPKAVTDIGLWKGNCYVVDNTGQLGVFKAGQRLYVQQVLDRNKTRKPFKSFFSGRFLFLVQDTCVLKIDLEELRNTPPQTVISHTCMTGVSAIVCEPTTGTIFISTLMNGFYVCKPRLFEVFTNTHTSAGDYPVKNNFLACLLLNDSTLFANNGQVLNLNHPAYKPAPDVADICLFRFHDSIWAHKDKELICYDTRLRPLCAIPYTEGSLTHMETDSENTVWLSSGSKLGFIRDNQIEFVCDLRQYQIPARIESFSILNDSTELIATRRGLYYFNCNTRQLRPRKDLPNLYARCLFKWTDDLYLVGTYGTGFYAVSDTGYFKFPLDANRYLETAHCFARDRYGSIWISTNKGIFQVDEHGLLALLKGIEQDLSYNYYDTGDGLVSNEFNGGCQPLFNKRHDGRILFPGIDGLVMLNPQKAAHIYNRNYQLVVDRISIDNVDYTQKTDAKIDPGFNQLMIYLAYSYYGAKNNLGFEYSIEGLNDNWIEVEGDHITITSLPSGNYKLYLREKHQNNAPAKLLLMNFSVKPHYYETLAFYVFAGILVISLFGAVYYVSLRAMRRQKERVEQLLSIRTAELLKNEERLKQAVKDLEKSSSNLSYSYSFIERIGQTLLHDLKSPMRFLVFISDLLSENKRPLTHEDLVEISDSLKTYAWGINNFIEDFSLWISANKQGLPPKREAIDLDALINELLILYKEISQLNGNTLNYVPAGMRVLSDIRMLKVVLRNIIDNANKHMQHGEILVTVKCESDKVLISVSDTGQGVDPTFAHSIENMSAREFGRIYNKNLGYIIIKDFVEKLQARIVITAREKGTVVTIELPCYEC